MREFPLLGFEWPKAEPRLAVAKDMLANPVKWDRAMRPTELWWNTGSRGIGRRQTAGARRSDVGRNMQQFTGSDPGTDRALAARRFARANLNVGSQQIDIVPELRSWRPPVN